MTRFLEGETMQENFTALTCYYNLSWREKEKIRFQGIRKTQILSFKELAWLNWEELAVLLAVTDRTLHLWPDQHKVANCYADRFMQHLHIFSLLYNAIPGQELSNLWLKAPCRELATRKPIEVLECFPGFLAVEQILKTKLRNRWNGDKQCKQSYTFAVRTNHK